ncbi:Septin-domain-containing protein [Cristinia sonorae]|uniref:Septin-domain-containing protein n=1 Tax=Cristinia sonorae TaxID=1940300 RepID=A0A8K0UUY2_9AGAR|nr:Septin-domain-containing protein [Cristinia sonorae]
MFPFRRRHQKKESEHDGPPFIRTSPSLPELSAQGIPWPENLVDISALPPANEPIQSPSKGAAKTSFHSNDGPIPFHKPFWTSSAGTGKDAAATAAAGKGAISALYMNTHPPVAFENRKGTFATRPRPSQKRSRNPTTFNIMVVGAQGTGKTSLLRLLLDTADISPTATADQRANMESFLRGSPKRTENIQTACVEICESKYDRLLLSVIDTPGLDFHHGHELKLERQVTSIVKYMDTQFADTLSEESKVVRQSKGDQHIHLCIYTVDPFSIMSASARKALSLLPSRTRSETTISHTNEHTPLHDEESDDESDDEDWSSLTMSPADIHVIRRLTKRANVLPVIARADSLTNDKLAAIKRVIRRDLDAAGLDFGVFGPIKDLQQLNKIPSKSKVNGNGHANGNGNSEENGDEAAVQSSEDGDADGDGDDASDVPEERTARPIIKLRASRTTKRRMSHSRSRRELSDAANEPVASEIDADSVASVRFSAHIVAKGDLGDALPFALIAPEYRRRKTPKPRPVSSMSEAHSTMTMTEAESAMPAPSEDGHAVSVADSSFTSPTSPTTDASSSRNFSYLAGPPADLKGVFVRRFRWGTVDVLSPEHCDFAALRTAVLSTHMKMLKVRTKEVLYEKFRTEKLLARRATANISEDATRRLLEDLGI